MNIIDRIIPLYIYIFNSFILFFFLSIGTRLFRGNFDYQSFSRHL